MTIDEVLDLALEPAAVAAAAVIRPARRIARLRAAGTGALPCAAMNDAAPTFGMPAGPAAGCWR